MTREVKASFPNSKVTTIPDPINTSLFRPHNRSRARIELFDSTANDPWVLFTTLSKSNPVKRIDLAMNAVHIARQRVPGLEIRVATGIPHASMPMFVSACDVALCTSTHEGWPNSIKEAIACGIPFVSTDVSDLREIASRHPSCHVSMATPEALADHMVQALKAPRDDSLRLEAEEMGIDMTCKRLLLAYKSVLK
jgi:glycosyltransferase involved in cell wall biosynthesis